MINQTFTENNKKKLKKTILNKLYSIHGVISVTLVGSFWKKNNLKNFSDIDIVIILKKISKKKYLECLKKINNLDLNDFNLGHLKLKINPTFGPLKFDNHDDIVFHTMIYDINSHIDHVIKSPFTCYDWERSKEYKGIALKHIFAVGKIQINDFFSSRRGIDNYLKNLIQNYVFFQRYEIRSKKLFLRKRKFKINKRHKIEFTFHLCNFLIINFYKFQTQKNEIPNSNEILLLFKRIFKHKYSYFYNNFLLLKEYKFKKDFNNRKIPLFFIKSFIERFKSYLRSYLKNKIIFLRHCKTINNDDTFFGIGRDIGIINSKKNINRINFLKSKKISMLHSSDLKRSIETAELISNQKIFISKDLREKNYGKAEGLNLTNLKKKYPKIVKAWENKKDPRFPSGENDSDVLERVKFFKKKLIKLIDKKESKGLIIVVTHNALLRCLVGDSFCIPRYLWVKMKFDHLEPLNFFYTNKQILPNINRQIFFKNFLIK